MSKRETLFRENTVRPYLDKLKHSHWFSIQQVSLRGHPDIIGVINGKFIAIELKDVGGEPRAIQQYHLDRVEESGGYAACVTRENWDIIKKHLLKLTKGGRRGVASNQVKE